MALSKIKKTILNSITNSDGYWFNSPNYSLKFYHYEGQDITTYHLPFVYVDVIVLSFSSNRGVALAFQWDQYDNGQYKVLPPIWKCSRHRGTEYNNWGNWVLIGDDRVSKAGDTMTGVLNTKGALNSDGTTTTPPSYALNLDNSNIYGVNAIYTADASDGASEGIHFYRDATHWDSLWANSGALLFSPNRERGVNTSVANSQKIARFSSTPSTNKLVQTNGTTGEVVSNNILSQAGECWMALKNTNVELGTSYSTDQWIGDYTFKDKNDTTMGYIGALYNESQMSRLRFLSRNKVNGSNVDHTLELRVSADGTKTVDLNQTAWRTALGLGTAAYTASTDYLKNQRTYTKFADIPTDPGLYYVNYSSTSDSEAPVTTSGSHWWNVLQIGASTRRIQIVSHAFTLRNILWYRVKHDSTWYGWYSIDGIKSKTISTGYTTILALANDYRTYYNFPITITKSGSTEYTDLPSGINSSSEFNALLIGTTGRATIFVTPFGLNSNTKIFRRDIYNGAWLTTWAEV